MKNDNLGDRMKTYENVTRNYLTRRMPVIIRIDGKAFHTMYHIDRMYEDFMVENNIEPNKDVDYLLDDVQYNIMKIAIKKEIGD